MRVRILDLDGSVIGQDRLVRNYPATIVERREWGPVLRLACSHPLFHRFEISLGGCSRSLATLPGGVTFLGSGDFHHVSLALLRQIGEPVNLLVIDNHPDWMRGVPFLHCGTWLYHAAKLPHVRTIFHVGGDVDFDNYYRPLAPWSLLRSGKIVVIPAIRSFSGGNWASVVSQPFKPDLRKPVERSNLAKILRPYWDQLARFPLYISLDKDVMVATDAVVNWDSGHLRLTDVLAILQTFIAQGGGRLAGMDIVGDWSPVRIKGLMRRLFHWTMHSSIKVHPSEALKRNQDANLAILATLDHSLHTVTGLTA